MEELSLQGCKFSGNCLNSGLHGAQIPALLFIFSLFWRLFNWDSHTFSGFFLEVSLHPWVWDACHNSCTSKRYLWWLGKFTDWHNYSWLWQAPQLTSNVNPSCIFFLFSIIALIDISHFLRLANVKHSNYIIFCLFFHPGTHAHQVTNRLWMAQAISLLLQWRLPTHVSSQSLM